MFFLEVSSTSKKNLELLQKVMRIRANHILKKKDEPEQVATYSERSESPVPKSSSFKKYQAFNDDEKRSTLIESFETSELQPQRQTFRKYQAAHVEDKKIPLAEPVERYESPIIKSNFKKYQITIDVDEQKTPRAAETLEKSEMQTSAQNFKRYQVSHSDEKKTPRVESVEKPEIQAPKSNFRKYQVDDDEKRTPIFDSARPEVNKQISEPIPRFRLDLRNREQERWERKTNPESYMERNCPNPLAGDKPSTEGSRLYGSPPRQNTSPGKTRLTSSPGNPRQTTSPEKVPVHYLSLKHLIPKRDERPLYSAGQSFFNSSSKSSLQDVLGDRPFEPLRSSDNTKEYFRPFSKTELSPKPDKSPQTNLEPPLKKHSPAAQMKYDNRHDEFITLHPKPQDNNYDSDQNRTQPPMPSPSNYDDARSKGVVQSSARRSVSTQNTRGEETTRRHFHDNLTVSSNISHQTLGNPMRRDPLQATPQFREKPASTISQPWQNQRNVSQKALHNPLEDYRSDDRVEPVAYPGPRVNKEYNNISFSQKGNNHLTESASIQPLPHQSGLRVQNTNQAQKWAHSSPPRPLINNESSNRSSTNDRASPIPKPESYHHKEPSRFKENRDFKENNHIDLGRKDSGSLLDQQENTTTKMSEEFQFISIGTNSEYGSIRQRKNNQENLEDIKFSTGIRRQPILSEIDQNIKRLEGNLLKASMRD